MDLTIKTEKGFFNHRVAAVIIHNNKLLAQKNIKENTYYLVGGRVSFGESSEEALIREIKEELNIDIKSYKPIWVNECFFGDSGNAFHEIGIYYLVDVSQTDFSHYETTFETIEGHRINKYEWLNIDEIDNVLIYPEFIKEEIKKTNSELKLLITRE